jgi:hypothetical protein
LPYTVIEAAQIELATGAAWLHCAVPAVIPIGQPQAFVSVIAADTGHGFGFS